MVRKGHATWVGDLRCLGRDAVVANARTFHEATAAGGCRYRVL